MPTFDAYIKCPMCGGKGYWYRNQRVGSQNIKTPVKCDKCEGKGEIMTSKLRLRPLYDQRGQPIDQEGKMLRHPEQEPWNRRMRRKQTEEEEHGKY